MHNLDTKAKDAAFKPDLEFRSRIPAVSELLWATRAVIAMFSATITALGDIRHDGICETCVIEDLVLANFQALFNRSHPGRSRTQTQTQQQTPQAHSH